MLDETKQTSQKVGIVAIAVALLCAIGIAALTGCAQKADNASGSGSSSGKEISVYSREDGSGTRGAFIELFGIEEKDSSGKKVDKTTDKAAISNSTSVMMTSVAGDPEGIGYISLGSLNDSVKAVKIEGVEATAENVKNGTYKVSRPFNIVLPKNVDETTQDFIDFIMSSNGQTIVEDNKYIAVAENAANYTASGKQGKVVVAGSSSVTPVMEKLAEAYQALNPNVVIEVQQSDSTTGVNMAVEGTCNLGMASRELKDSESSNGVTAQPIALDGIAVIVAPASKADNLTKDQVKNIFTGALTNWAEVIG